MCAQFNRIYGVTQFVFLQPKHTNRIDREKKKLFQ